MSSVVGVRGAKKSKKAAGRNDASAHQLALIKNQIFKFREPARRQPEIRDPFGCGAKIMVSPPRKRVNRRIREVAFGLWRSIAPRGRLSLVPRFGRSQAQPARRGFNFSPAAWRARANMTGGFQSANTPENPDSLRPFSEGVAGSGGAVAKMCRAPGRSRVFLRRGVPSLSLGGQMSESQWANSKPAREVDRVFGDGHAAAHPELVVAIVHAASSHWTARVITAGLQDIASR